ncbi:MAG: hypothetical protein IPF93_15220 [Saprospiraceae bacterium]|nr:hypothetical protein [Saprospiraceae bacterium]
MLKAKVTEWLMATNPWPLADKRWYELSISEQRKALLVRAMIKNAPLLILGCHCRAWTMINASELIEMINTVCAYGERTLIFVTLCWAGYRRCGSYLAIGKGEHNK